MSLILDGTAGVTFNNSTVQASAGVVLQVVSATKTDTASFSSSTFSDITGLSVSITPKFSTSKFLIIANVNGGWNNGVTKIGIRLLRNSTAISIGDAAGSRTQVSGVAYWPVISYSPCAIGVNYLDSPATTSAITYKFQANAMDNAGSVTINKGGDSDIDTVSTSRTASTITVMEIAG
jgi:hypothetical protein